MTIRFGGSAFSGGLPSTSHRCWGSDSCRKISINFSFFFFVRLSTVLPCSHGKLSNFPTFFTFVQREWIINLKSLYHGTETSIHVAILSRIIDGQRSRIPRFKCSPTEEPIDCRRWRHTTWPQQIRFSFGLSPTQLHNIIEVAGHIYQTTRGRTAQGAEEIYQTLR